MKGTGVVASAILAFGGVEALKTVQDRHFPGTPDPATNNVVKLDLTKVSPGVLAKRALETRQISTPDVNYKKSLLYIVQLIIGTPPQSTFVQLDTGSSDLVVETSVSNLCSAPAPNPCSNFGPYDANSSSTYSYIDSNFQVAYAGGDGATGDWVSDVIGIGGAVLPSAQFGIMYQTTVTEGVLGVSYEAIEGRSTFSGAAQYPNLPRLLVQNGYIHSRAYSLWTNDDRSTAGTLLFGGVDSSKFTAPLITIDLVASGFDGLPGVVDFTVPLRGVSGTDEGGNAVVFAGGATTINLILDSGTTLTQLPAALVSAIWAFSGATPYSQAPNFAYIPCAAALSTKIVSFAFDCISINIPLSQLVIFPDSNNDFCTFGIAIGDPIIGDTVLAAMYVVYDLDNNQVSLANTVFNSTAPENIQPIVAGPGGVPGAVHGPCAVSSSSVVAASSTVSPSSYAAASSAVVTAAASSSPPAAVSSSSANPTSSVESPSSASSSEIASASSTLEIGPASSTLEVALSSSSSDVASASSTLEIAPASSTLEVALSSSSSDVASASSTLEIAPASSTLEVALSSSSSDVASASSTLEIGPASSTLEVAPSSSSSDVASASSTLEIAPASSTLEVAPSSSSSEIVAASSSSSSEMASPTSSTSIADLSTSSSSGFTTFVLSTTTVAPVVVPEVCNRNNCLRAIVGATASDFCSLYLAGVPAATPTKVAKGCQGLSSRISSGCACYITATGIATVSPSVPIVIATSTTAAVTSSTLAIASSTLVDTATTTAAPLPTATAPGKCSADNCFRAVKRAGPPAVCAAYGMEGFPGVPAAVKKGCDVATRVSSACDCLFTSPQQAPVRAK